MRVKKCNYIKLAFIALALGSCVKKNVDSSATIHIGIPGEPKTLDWNAASDSVSKGFLDSLVPRLLSYDKSGKAEISKKSILTSITTTNESFTSWNFKIKDSLKWSDGEPLTPQHVVDSFIRVQNNTVASPCGIRARKLFKAVKVLRDKSIQVDLNFSYPNLPQELTRICYSPIRNDLISKDPEKWFLPERLITCGPMVLESYKIGTGALFKRVRPEKSKPQTIKFSFFSSTQPMLHLYENGDLDFVPLLPPDEISRLELKPGFKHIPLFMVNFLVLNTQSKAFKSQSQRQAFVRLFDKKPLKNFKRYYKKTNQYFLPDLFLNDEIKKQLADIHQKSLKTPLTFSSPELKVLTNNSELQLKWIQVLQSQLKNKNIKLEISSKDWVSYLNDAELGKTDLVRMSWASDTAQVNDFLELWLSNSPLNRSGLKSTKYDALVDQIQKVHSATKRNDLIAKALSLLLYEESIIIPVFEEEKVQLLNPKIKNFPDLPFHIYDFSDVSI